jgi:hypothetical protein
MPTDEEVMIKAGQDESFGFGAMAAKGAIATGLLGASAAMMRGQTPGGIRRTTADYALGQKPSEWLYSQAKKLF